MGDPFKRMAMGVCALASRRISTFRLSDNVTWLRPGGLSPTVTLPHALLEATCDWQRWCEGISLSRPRGQLRLQLSSADQFRIDTRPDVIVTSPPYANRLDYTRMWAPESAVVLALVERSLDALPPFIGSNAIAR